MKKLMFMVTVVLLTACSLQAGYQSITLDTDYSDWASVPAISDPFGSDAFWGDIEEFKVCNDGENLYFYVLL